MDYKNFIDEIRTYLEEAKSLFDAEQLENDQSYRKWRHNLTDLIDRIESKGYSINSSIRSRYFSNTNLPGTSKDNIEIFNRGIQDTIIELEALISNFDKYGDSGKSIAEDKALNKPPEWPQKITLFWLFKNAPIGLWIKGGSLLVVVFLLGLAIGQSQLFFELKSKLKPEKESINQTISIQKSGN